MCEQHAKSCILLCNLVQTLLTINQGVTTAADLELLLIEHGRTYQDAYGADAKWIPKMHHILHLGAYFKRDGVLLACFLQERKHRVAKRFAIQRHYTANLELGVLKEIALVELNMRES